eukprot:TRINITY_DN13365_c0_g2_i1.p1 TRINITY_DN13365_c0_g2~~TRINITY_DN13365_c0_g2_i1.p1  ORF type:complete len:189 (-),score=22.16 TRINITY_DN13365_c0_g2_i1:159-725(-)
MPGRFPPPGYVSLVQGPPSASAFLPEVQDAKLAVAHHSSASIPSSAHDFLFDLTGKDAELVPSSHHAPASFADLGAESSSVARPSSLAGHAGLRQAHAQAFFDQSGHDSHPHPSLGDHFNPQVHEASLNVMEWGVVKSLKTVVLVTGGLCSKLFGIGLMGFLAFQSVRANMNQPPQQLDRNKRRPTQA